MNNNAIFVFGNQKSGTTVIAALLANYAGLSITLDIHTFTVKEQDLLHKGDLKLEEFIYHHLHEFSRDVIKEPALTFLYKDVKRVFSSPKSIFVVRDPRDNIRSILNRINRSGNCDFIEKFGDIPGAWQRIVDNRWLGLPYEHYIESLAARWNLAVDVYLQQTNDFVLVKYEDFLSDKVNAIEVMAEDLSLVQVNDIKDKLDIQYQPRGDRVTPAHVFFGRKNLDRINEICLDRMEYFGYS